jgi:NSS family neurotransmitter:Na+ symporter
MSSTREQWGSSLGFLMAAAGSAIGLGSLWLFPYLVGEHGGGLFVLLYILFTFLIALPIFIAEIIMGRSVQKTPIFAFSELSKRSQNWKMAGWVMVFTSFLILSYYSVVAGWSLNYVLMSLTNFTQGKSASQIANLFNILYESADLNIFWHFLFMFLTVSVVYGGVQKGIEKWSKILTPLLFILLIILVVHSATLSGFAKGVKFLFLPDMKHFSASSILAALGMSFFTLSVGMGIIITYGSYMQKNEDIPKTSSIVALMTVAISLLATLMIFPIIFTYNLSPQEGPGLVFKTLPIVFETFKATLVLSTIFFTLLLFTALTSSISLLEMVTASVMEIMHWPRKKSTIVVGIATFIMGIPSAVAGSGSLFPDWHILFGKNFFETIAALATDWLLPLGGLFVTIFVGWRVDKTFKKHEFSRGSHLKPLYFFWSFLLKWVAPIAIILIILKATGMEVF